MISRDFTWLDENVEHSDADCARASALAKKWSQLKTQEEHEGYRRQFECERGDGPEPCEDCDACLNDDFENCIYILDCIRTQNEYRAERDLEIELVEDKLEKLGARMMRPYEHWNEDERYMEYMDE